MTDPPRRRDAGLGSGDTHRSTDLDQPTTIFATCGPMFCEVRYWTEAEWAALPERDRPPFRTHAPGRGWFAAVPVAGLN